MKSFMLICTLAASVAASELPSMSGSGAGLPKGVTVPGAKCTIFPNEIAAP